MEKIIGTVPGKCRKKREKARLTLNNNPEISWHMKKSRRTYNGVHLNKKSNTQDVVEQSLTTYPYHKRKLKLVPGFYPNGWLALSLEVPKTGEAYTVLTVNLEDFPAFGIPDKAFVDINNNPEAMDFLIRYNLAEDTGYRRRSGWVEYPMVKLNLPELYRISPAYFEESGQQSIM